MNAKINTFLPIIISTILPVIGLYSNADFTLNSQYGFFPRWLSASIFLYGLWHLLSYVSNLEYRYKKGLLVLILTVLFSCFHLLIQQSNLDFPPLILGRLFFVVVLMLIIQYAIRSQQNISSLLLEKEQIQTENYKAQLKALQTKVDPHFLFNSLNTLRSMVRQQHANSEQFIISLSDFYRQTLKHNENSTIQLLEELEVLQSYLFLMKNRNEEAVSVDINIDKALHFLHLPTLALQIVVENCFKHNSMTSKMPLLIKVTSTIESYITISNNIQAKIEVEDSSGYGLDLLRKRYEFLNIPDGVIVQKTADEFIVKLKLIN